MPVAPTAEVLPQAETAQPATVHKAQSKRRRSSLTMAATAARQAGGLSDGVAEPSAVAHESPTPRAAAKRGASLNELQGAVVPGTHLVRPVGKSTRGSIDEKDPYSP